MGVITVVTSGKGGVGKSTVAAGVGAALARRRRRVLLIVLLRRLLEISSKYSITAEQQDMIPLASALHDIGKIGIDEKVLNKPGRLTPESKANHAPISSPAISFAYFV